MLHELFPDAKNIGLLYCSAEPNSLYQVETIQGYLEELGYTCKMYSFSDSNDLSSVATTAASESDVIYVPTDNTVASNTAILDNICRAGKGSGNRRRGGYLRRLRRGNSFHQLL